jgi:hypothetical protein
LRIEGIGQLFTVWRAARTAREHLKSVKDDNGGHRLTPFPPVASRKSAGHDLTRIVPRLRLVGRLRGGFLDPVDDAIFLTAALRGLGFEARFHLGRELVPAQPPAGYFAWVSVDDVVVSTSIPVRQEYVDVGYC